MTSGWFALALHSEKRKDGGAFKQARSGHLHTSTNKLNSEATHSNSVVFAVDYFDILILQFSFESWFKLVATKSAELAEDLSLLVHKRLWIHN